MYTTLDQLRQGKSELEENIRIQLSKLISDFNKKANIIINGVDIKCYNHLSSSNGHLEFDKFVITDVKLNIEI